MKDEIHGALKICSQKACREKVINGEENAEDSNQDSDVFLKHRISTAESENDCDDTKNQVRPVFAIVEPPGGAKNACGWSWANQEESENTNQYKHDASNLKKLFWIHWNNIR